MEDHAQLQACAFSVAALQVRVATAESEQTGTRLLMTTKFDELHCKLAGLAKALERLSEDSALRARR